MSGTDEGLAPGSSIGILGGGQLGRMLAMAAARLGYRVIVLDPDPAAPTAQVANEHLVGKWDDPAALTQLAERCDVVTYEFENVPDLAVETLGPLVEVRPGPQPLSVAQDRLVEKTFLNDAGIPTARFVAVDDQAGLEAAVEELGGSAVIKTRRLGYDGKGQLRVTGQAPADGFASLGGVPCIAEEWVPFEAEISVIGARSVNGQIVCFEPARNEHRDGILASSTVPCGVERSVGEAAVAATNSLLDNLAYVGVLGLELFVLADGSLLANEFAPRVHNSGHWTEAACVVSQFEQHIRAVAGLPLLDPGRHSDCVMENLLGDEVNRVPELLNNPNALVHLYGKAEVRPGRKMGHVTTLMR